jgi:hypothetical protein
MGPERRFSSKDSNSSFNNEAMLSGISPVSLFHPRCTILKLSVLLNRLFGISPLRSLPVNLSVWRLCKFCNSCGIPPTKLFPARRLVRLPRVWGMVPDKLLYGRTRVRSRGRLPSSFGRAPMRLLLLRIRLARKERLPSCGAITPGSGTSSNSRPVTRCPGGHTGPQPKSRRQWPSSC